MDENEDDQGYSPTITLVIAWAKEYEVDWECDQISSNRIHLSFARDHFPYTATAAEEEPCQLTLRVFFKIDGAVDELQLHRKLAEYNGVVESASVTYHHRQGELLWRDSIILPDDEGDDGEPDLDFVEEMIMDAMAAFERVRIRLVDVLGHTSAKPNLALMAAQGSKC